MGFPHHHALPAMPQAKYVVSYPGSSAGSMALMATGTTGGYSRVKKMCQKEPQDLHSQITTSPNSAACTEIPDIFQGHQMLSLSLSAQKQRGGSVIPLPSGWAGLASHAG